MVFCNTQNIRREGKPCSPYTLDPEATPKTEITTDSKEILQRKIWKSGWE